MKKLALTFASISLVATLQADNHNMAGCGLGAMIFPENDQVSQILAGTTNGTSGNQTFGISTGTLGCTPDGAMAQNEKLNIFTSENLDKLALDIAQGEGETLDTFVELNGISNQTNKKEFVSKLQNNFSSIFTNENVTAGEVLLKIKNI
jgi:hypothetical protein